MNIKKIGLTALAGSLVATTAAVSAELTINGGASIGVSNIDKTQSGKDWSMGNNMYITGSEELDNGLVISTSFELDANSAQTNNSPFDNHSVTVASESLGTLVFSGHGGSSAQSAIDTTAAGDAWNTTLGITGPSAAAAGNDSMFYTLPSMVDDVTVTASYSPGRAAQDSHTSWAIGFTGVEGLTLNFGQGDSGAPGSEIESTTMKGSYAIGSFTVGYSNTDNDKTGASNREVTSYSVAYTVSDDLSINYGSETFDTTGQSVDEEVETIGVSYTSGGVTLAANSYAAEGISNTAGASGEKEKWALSATFAF
jgi:outer membrane protein OmpU